MKEATCLAVDFPNDANDAAAAVAAANDVFATDAAVAVTAHAAAASPICYTSH